MRSDRDHDPTVESGRFSDVSVGFNGSARRVSIQVVQWKRVLIHPKPGEKSVSFSDGYLWFSGDNSGDDMAGGARGGKPVEPKLDPDACPCKGRR